MSLSLWPTEDETIEGAGRALREGRVTCVGLVERCLAKIEEWEPKVKAWVVVAKDSALTHARALDTLLAQGTDLGPKHGIPIGVKDIIDVRGLPTRAGAERWSKGPAEADAPIVRNLQLSGAIILGKTVTTPYAYLDPPPTRNPWNLDRTPGGSSSGSAAAVTSGMCLAAIGTQTVGSITRPASFCGVCSWKPCWDPSPTEGVVPLAASLDVTGLIARSIRDLALIERPRDWAQWLIEPDERGGSPGPPSLGIMRGPFEELAEPPMRAAMAEAIEAWRSAGAEIVEVEPPPLFEEVWPAMRALVAAQAAEYHDRRFAEDPDDYPFEIKSLILEGLKSSAIEYVRAVRVQEQFRSVDFYWSRHQHALVVPAAVGPAPGPETTGNSVFNGPWNFLNLPTLSFPIGLSPDEMPLGVQFVGHSYRMDHQQLFRAAAWCERVLRSDAQSQRA